MLTLSKTSVAHSLPVILDESGSADGCCLFTQAGVVARGDEWILGYEAASGVRISRDPIAEDGGINLYAYCGGDPVNFVDRLGLEESEWRLDLHDHGKPHFQRGNERWDARTLQPIEHAGHKPLPLNKKQIEELRKSGLLDKAIKNVSDTVAEEVAKKLGESQTRNMSKCAARRLAKEILKKLPLVSIVFAGVDYAEGGVEQAAKNAVIPGQLIEDVVNDADRKYNEWLDGREREVFNSRLRKAGLDNLDE